MTQQSTAPPSPRGSGRISNRLVALSSAAVMTVYAAGYLRTRSAAERLEAAERPRVVIPAPAPAVTTALADQKVVATSTAPPTAVAQVPLAVTAAPEARPAAKKRPVPAAKPAKQADTTGATPAPSPVPVANAPQPVAEAVPTPAPQPTPTPAPQFKDGTYSGWGSSRHGDIQATVVIQDGRIVSAVISQCWTRYSCSWVAHLQGQVVTRQSAEVDYVSGATQSANAFYYAVVDALAKAK